MLKVAVFTSLGVALLGVAFGWYRLRGAVRDTSLPTWRKATLGLGLLAVTSQVFLLIPIYVDTSHYTAILDRLDPRWWLHGVVFLFLLAVPCILTGKDWSKWWLSVSSLCLLVFCFLVLLDY